MTGGRTWILTTQGDLINLQYLSKVRMNIVPASAKYQLIFYHAIASGRGATQLYAYGNEAELRVAFNKVLTVLQQNNAVTNLAI